MRFLIIGFLIIGFVNSECFDKWVWDFDNCIENPDPGRDYICESQGIENAFFEVNEHDGDYVNDGVLSNATLILNDNSKFLTFVMWFDPILHARFTILGVEYTMKEVGQGTLGFIEIDDGYITEVEKSYKSFDFSDGIHQYILVYKLQEPTRLNIFNNGEIVFSHNILQFDLSSPIVEIYSYVQDEKIYKFEVIPAEFGYAEVLQSYNEGYTTPSPLQICINATDCSYLYDEIEECYDQLEDCYNSTSFVCPNIEAKIDLILELLNECDECDFLQQIIDMESSILDIVNNLEIGGACNTSALFTKIENIENIVNNLEFGETCNETTITTKIENIENIVNNLEFGGTCNETTITTNIGDYFEDYFNSLEFGGTCNETSITTNIGDYFEEYFNNLELGGTCNTSALFTKIENIEIIVNNLEFGGTCCCNETKVLEKIENIDNFLNEQDFTNVQIEILTIISQFDFNQTHHDIKDFIEAIHLLHNMSISHLTWLLTQNYDTLQIIINNQEETNENIENIENMFLYINNTLIDIQNKQDECCEEPPDCYKWIHLFEDCKIQNMCKYPEVFIQGNCELITCYGILYIDEEVCSGNGVCIGYNECECRPGFTGDQCESIEC